MLISSTLSTGLRQALALAPKHQSALGSINDEQEVCIGQEAKSAPGEDPRHIVSSTSSEPDPNKVFVTFHISPRTGEVLVRFIDMHSNKILREVALATIISHLGPLDLARGLFLDQTG